ncbi:MAG: hypothetical protein J6A90_08180 [Clostridia bacterium]|nr:hypothetical protein [Clostridia bacterium]
MHNTKKSFILRLISAVIMTFMLAFLLSGCTHKKVTQTDITVTPDDESYEYSEASVSYAQNAVYSCLYAYEKEKSGAPNQEKINSLKKQAEKIQKSFPKTLEPKKYDSLFISLNANSDKIAKGLVLLGGDEKIKGFEELKDAYLALTDTVDGEYIGELLYNAALAAYDEKYEAQISAYEKYGHEYMLDKANEYAERKQTFISDIGAENVSYLIEYALLIGDLYCGTAFDGDEISSFTNEEILIFFKSLDLSEITVTDLGYELILETYAETIIADKSKSFFDKVIFEAERNGDVSKFAVAISKTLSLIAESQSKLTTADIELLRQGSFDELIFAMIERFDDSAWARFDSALTQEINKEAYNALAKSYYKDGFDIYLQAGKSATLEELKASCGTDGFNKTLKEYIFGICPAFSYNMNF